MIQSQRPASSFALPSNVSFEPTHRVYEAFEAADALWTIETHPVAALVPSVSMEVGVYDRPVAVPGTVAHLRANTSTVVGITSAHYAPFDNLQVAETIHRMLDASPDPLAIDSIITYSGGSGLIVGIAGGRYDIGGDPMQHRLYVHTRHDGRGGLSVFPMQTRLKCANQVAYGISQGITLRHSRGIERAASDLVGIMANTWQKALDFRALGELMSAKTETERYPRVIAEYLNETLPMPTRRSGESVEALERRLATWRTRYDAAEEDIMDRMHFSAAMDGVPMNRWRTFNALTEHEEHRKTRGDANVSRAMATSAAHKRKLVALEVCLAG
jgi:hypothetical protein